MVHRPQPTRYGGEDMYIEIDNKAPIQIVNGEPHKVGLRGENAVTQMVFPDGTDLLEAIQTVKHTLPWHSSGASVKAVRSDDADLEQYLSEFYGVKPRMVRGTSSALGEAIGAMGAMATVLMLMAATRLALRYNNGASWQAGIMGNPASTGTGAYAPGIYLALSSDSTAPQVGDTTLAGEIVSGTLSRAQATYGYTSGATSFTESKIFTSDQTVTIYKDALFNVASGGSPLFGSLLYVNGVPTPKTLSSGDQVGITESVSF